MSSSSFDSRINAEWGDVKSSGGSSYVPDVNNSMDAITMQINIGRLDKAIEKFSAQPAPSWLMDLYNKEISGGGSSVTKAMKEIVAYLQGKRAAYATALTKKVGSAPPPPAPATTNIPDLDSNPTIENPTGSTSVTDTSNTTNNVSIDPNTGLPVKKSNTKLYLIVGGISLLVIVATIVIVKRRKSN